MGVSVGTVTGVILGVFNSATLPLPGIVRGWGHNPLLRMTERPTLLRRTTKSAVPAIIQFSAFFGAIFSFGSILRCDDVPMSLKERNQMVNLWKGQKTLKN